MRSLLLVSLLSLATSCTASQGAAAKADLSVLAGDLDVCTTAEVKAALPQVAGYGLQVLAGTTGSTAALEATGISDAEALGICAGKAALAKVERLAAKPPDGGSSIAAADVARAEINFRAYVAQHVGKVRARPKV